MATRSVAAYCLVFGLLAIPDAFTGQPFMNAVWAWLVGVMLFGSVFALGVAGLFRWRARALAGAVSIIFAVVIVSWPFAAADMGRVHPGAPWPWSLANVAIAAAALSFRFSLAVVYTVAVPSVYVVIRVLPAGGSVSVQRALCDGGYTFILGFAILILMRLLRQAARDVDSAQQVASSRYGTVIRDHQTELERVQVDSILHDSVLTTFLTAARAHTEPEKQFAVAMATHALSEVASTAVLPGVDTLVSVEKLRTRFESACEELGIAVTIIGTGVTEHSLPSSVVETLFAATLQALTNSVQHAGFGPVTRTVYAALKGGTVTIEIVDDGAGFDTATMTPGRLGVRVSIIERLQNVGGHASIFSTPGLGTTVHLEWSDPDTPEK